MPAPARRLAASGLLESVVPASAKTGKAWLKSKSEPKGSSWRIIAEFKGNSALGKSIDGLSDERRIEHYRGLALDALAKAHEAPSDEQRLGFIELAQSWTKVAEEAARWTRPLSGHK